MPKCPTGCGAGIQSVNITVVLAVSTIALLMHHVVHAVGLFLSMGSGLTEQHRGSINTQDFAV